MIQINQISPAGSSKPASLTSDLPATDRLFPQLIANFPPSARCISPFIRSAQKTAPDTL
jgi:hypothetical protein